MVTNNCNIISEKCLQLITCHYSSGYIMNCMNEGHICFVLVHDLWMTEKERDSERTKGLQYGDSKGKWS